MTTLKLLILSFILIPALSFAQKNTPSEVAKALAVSSDKTSAKPAAPVTVVNQILFSESEQSWSSRDMQLFEKVMAALDKKNISPWSEGPNEDFLLSRLSYREAVVFGVSPEKLTITDGERRRMSEFTAKEIDDELSRLSLVTMFIDLKENQLKQKERFKIWFEHVKRKYQVRVKSAQPLTTSLAQ